MDSDLITQRLRIRKLGESDFDAMLAVYGDVEAMRYVDDGEPIGTDECRRWIDVTRRNYEARGYGMFAVELAETNAVIGFAGLVHPGGQVACELKYAYRREQWGRGYATEAAQALIGYGWRVHGLERIIATTAPENAPSHRVLRKAGMRDAGVRTTDDGERVQYFEWQPASGSLPRLEPSIPGEADQRPAHRSSRAGGRRG